MQNQSTNKWPLDRVNLVEVWTGVSVLQYVRVPYQGWGLYKDGKVQQERIIDEDMFAFLLGRYEDVGCMVLPVSKEDEPALNAKNRDDLTDVVHIRVYAEGGLTQMFMYHDDNEEWIDKRGRIIDPDDVKAYLKAREGLDHYEIKYY
ncbi:hypothetical protein D1872_181490 [compost metagenome]